MLKWFPYYTTLFHNSISLDIFYETLQATEDLPITEIEQQLLNFYIMLHAALINEGQKSFKFKTTRMINLLNIP